MRAFPSIDTPCPLDADAQRAIDGHCSHCDKHVHRLDGMSACERRALFASATGPICVSYRKPVPRRVGRIGAVIAATLITSAAHASEPVSTHAPPAATSTVAEALQAVKEGHDESDDVLDVLIMGGISAPDALVEDDDATLPALPVHVVEDTSATTTPSTKPSETPTPLPRARR